MALPRRLGEGDGADVDRVRDAVAHATLKAVTGRSASTTVDVVAGITSVSQGDAASCRSNVVYAWMSTVLPVIQTRTCGTPVESTPPGAAMAPGVPGARLLPPATEMPVSQV